MDIYFQSKMLLLLNW